MQDQIFSISQHQIYFVPIVSWLLALICAGIAVARGQDPVTREIIADKLLRYVFVFPVGLMGLWAGFAHVFIPNEAAASIGWETSPFQTEIGMANFAFGVAGIYAAFSTWQARMAAGLVVIILLIGAGFVHINSMLEEGNFAPGNAGPIFFTDFLTPLAIVVLLWMTRRATE